MSQTQRVNPHPWRTKNTFVRIMEKASPENKYSKKMPRDLVNLRKSLDMKDRRSNSKMEDKGELHILPELKKYMNDKKKESGKKIEAENQ